MTHGHESVHPVKAIARLSATSAAGPTLSLTSRPGVGAVGPDCLRLDIPRGADGRLVAEVPLLSDMLTPSDRLEYYVFAEFAPGHLPDSGPLHWSEGGYASTGVGIDLIFADGRRLTTSRARDHHGFGVDAEDQGLSRSISTDQWTRKEIDLAAFAGTMILGAEIHVSAHAATHDARAWIDGPFLRADEHAEISSRADLVDTRRGTHSSGSFSRGNTVPATALPHGGVLIVPLTSVSDASWPYSYHRDNDVDNATPFRGIALSHAATPWFGDWGVLHILPAPDDLDDTGSRFDHLDESAKPHEYAVRLENGISVRMAPTTGGAVGLFRFRGQTGAVVFDEEPVGGEVTIIDHHGGRVILVRNGTHGQMIAGAPVTHYAIAFDTPFCSDPTSVSGGWCPRLVVRFESGEVLVRIATSTIDAESALRRLDAAISDAENVEDAVVAASASWNSLLDRVRVQGASPDQLTTVYSCLYRLFLYPSSLGESSGEDPSGIASPDVFAFRASDGPRGGSVSGEVVINNGFWDTYRTAWPAYALWAPELSGRLLDGFVRHFHESGWVPRWSAPGFVDCMVGTSSDVVFADAIAKGVQLHDLEGAYDSGLKNALVPSPERSAGRVGLERALFLGYVPDDVHEGMSWTLETAINDFGLAALSLALLERLGTTHPRAAELRANAAYFRDRSRGYARMYDATTGFFRGRKADGSFSKPDEQFNPRAWGGDYVETNAFGMNFAAPHDGAGLARLFGGRDRLRERLDAYFDTHERGDEAAWGRYGRNIHEMTEARDIRMGMFAVSNQPAHHIPYMYAHTDDKGRMQQIVRESVLRLFLGSEFGQGYPGDEDNGEMSCWYLFSVLGLYPLTVGAAEYVITSPLFPLAEFDVTGGRTVRIETSSSDPSHVFIQSVHVDGEEWRRVTIDHATLMAGCRIEIALGAEPSEWFEGSYPASVTTDGEDLQPLEDLDRIGASVTGDFSDAAMLYDNDALTEAHVPPGGALRYTVPAAVETRLYTVTCGQSPEDGPSSWTLFSDDADEGEGETTVLGREAGVVWRWPHETRVFEVTAPAVSRTHTLRFDDPHGCGVAEVQLLARC